jgi:RNAse (barnase) inhibitor barstar
MAKTVSVDCSRISYWNGLHDIFAEALGFPAYYGRNSSAWIDCMTWPNEECSAVELSDGEVLTVQLESAQTLKEHAPQLLTDILEMSAFVNYRRIQAGEPPILIISGHIGA